MYPTIDCTLHAYPRRSFPQKLQSEAVLSRAAVSLV